MAIARGQITIVDLNDARTVNMFLSSNHPTTQIFSQDGKTYTPNYNPNEGGTSLVITPELLVSGITNPSFSNTSDQNSNSENAAILAAKPEWTINNVKVDANTTFATVGQSAPYALTINKNLLVSEDQNGEDIPVYSISCSAQWFDSKMKTWVPVKASIEFHRSINTGQLCMARIDSTGQYFKYGPNGPTPASIDLTAVLIRGSKEDTTPTDSGEPKDGTFSVTWYKRGIEGANPADGEQDGWIALSNEANKWTINGNKLTVFPDGVDSQTTFRVRIKDTYSKSAGYNKYFYDSYSIMDLTDPFSLVVKSTNGDSFKNGVVDTDIVATVQSGGEDVKGGYTIKYYWQKYDADDSIDNSFIGKGNLKPTDAYYSDYGIKVGEIETVDNQEVQLWNNKIKVTANDISSRATFFCEAKIE